MRTEIGATLYLFHRQGNFANDVVISAHGGYPRNRPTFFNVPNDVQFLFYSLHDEPATDFGLAGFTNSTSKIKETKAAGAECVNYNVSKYQERAAGKGLWSFQGFRRMGRSKESYGTIADNLTSADELNDMYAGALATMTPQEIQAKYSITRPIPLFDVVTIRNRWFSGDAAYSSGMLDLRTVLERVQQVHTYATVHCFFCRVPY